MDFHGMEPKLFEIHAAMAGRVGNIRLFEINIFKMLKSTKKKKKHKNS